MELIVLLLIVSLGVNVLLGLRTVKLSNKVDSAEIELDYYKRLADFWHKHYEANKECQAFDAMVKSQSILEEAYHELGEWYKTVTKERDEWMEDYNTLTAQYNVIDRLYSSVNDNMWRVDGILHDVIHASLRDKDLYDKLYDISDSFFMDYYVIPEHDDNGEDWYADEYIYNLYDEDDKYGGKFYWDYADELAGRELYVYYYNEIGM